MKKIAFLFISLLLVFQVFADTDVYAGADKETAAVIKEVDKLIDEQKYETAFKKLSDAKRNEYIINKQVEMCLDDFSQSIMHQMFAFKDLEKDETLYDVRTSGNQQFNLVMFNPVEVIEEYEKEHGEIPLLQMALGDYYCDVVWRYSGNWLISDEELIAKAIYHLEKAAEKMTLNSPAYCHLGEMYFDQGDYEKAISFFKTAIDLYPESALFHYNLGWTYYTMNDYNNALVEVEKSANLFTDTEQKFEKFLFAMEIAIKLNDTNKIIKYGEAAKKIIPNNYIPYQNLMVAYLVSGDIKNADKNADDFFAFGPAKPYAGQTVMDIYLKYGKVEEFKEFLERNLKKYSKQNDAMANLYFYYTSLYLRLGDTENTKKYANLAKEYFEKVGTYTDELKQILAPYL